MSIRLLLVDDHALLRESLAQALSLQDDLQVVGEAGDGREALDLAVSLAPDVVVLDVAMPRLGGLETAQRIRQLVPRARILACSQYTDAETVLGMLRQGATGYVNKAAELDELLEAIRAVAAGRRFLGRDVEEAEQVGLANARARRPDPTQAPRLTEREREVLQLIAEGRRSKEIGAILGMSVRTVETHRARIMRKLGIRSVAGLTKYALRHRITGPE